MPQPGLDSRTSCMQIKHASTESSNIFAEVNYLSRKLVQFRVATVTNYYDTYGRYC